MPTNVLFLAEGQLGDLLLLTPAIRGLKQTFPECRISVLALERRSLTSQSNDENSLPLIRPADSGNPLSTNPYLESVFVLDRSGLKKKSGWKRMKAEFTIVRFLRAQQFDAIICTFPEDRFAVWAFLSGTRFRVGQRNQPLKFLLNVTPDIEKSDKGVLEYYCDLVRHLGVRVTSLKTEFHIPSESGVWASKFVAKESLGHGFVIVHPGATGAYKIWPPSNFAEVIDAIQLTLGLKVLLCSSRYDGAVTQEIKNRLKSRVAEADTGGDVGRLAGLMAKSKLCISNDSGPRHLAVAVGIPSVSVFRRHIHKEWKIYPENVDISTIQGERQCPQCPVDRCLDSIPAGETFGSWCVRRVEPVVVLDKIKKMVLR